MDGQSAIDSVLSSPDPVVEVVQKYQRLYACWGAAHDPLERDQLRLQLRNVQEILWTLIADALMQIARGWAGSVVGKEHMSVAPDDALTSLALSLYIYVAEELPRLTIDPSKNVLGLLMTIVRRRLIDEQRKLRREIGSAPRGSRIDAAQPDLGIQTSGVSAIYHEIPLEEIADPHSKETEEQLIDRLYNQALWEGIHDYWQRTLTPEDQLIMQRWESDPPTPFRQIADTIGTGWTESMVRQRHYRIMKRTRQYLTERQSQTQLTEALEP